VLSEVEYFHDLSLVGKIYQLLFSKDFLEGHTWWYMSVIPATQEVEVEGL
jgi:hypothetical protein